MKLFPLIITGVEISNKPFSSSSRHQHEGVVAQQNAVDRCQLVWTESSQSECVLELLSHDQAELVVLSAELWIFPVVPRLTKKATLGVDVLTLLLVEDGVVVNCVWLVLGLEVLN